MRRLSTQILESLFLSRHSLMDIEPAYIHKNRAFLLIPSYELKRINSERRAGLTEHSVRFWHPDITTTTDEGEFYLTEVEFEKEVGGSEFNLYRDHVNRKAMHIQRHMAHSFDRDLDIFISKVIKIEDIFVQDSNGLVNGLVKEVDKLSLPPYLNKKHPNYSTSLAAAIGAWSDAQSESEIPFAKRAEKYIQKNYPQIKDTPRKQIARIANPDHNKTC